MDDKDCCTTHAGGDGVGVHVGTQKILYRKKSIHNQASGVEDIHTRERTCNELATTLSNPSLILVLTSLEQSFHPS